MSTVEACDGRCCVAFPLSVSYDRLRDRWPWIEDADKILDMIIALTPEDAADLRATAGAEPPDPSDDQHYSCRYFDPAARKCTNYDGRPALCRDYPYRDNACNHCGGQRMDLVAIAEAA